MGEAWVGEELMSAPEAFEKAGSQPLQLGSKGWLGNNKFWSTTFNSDHRLALMLKMYL